MYKKLRFLTTLLLLAVSVGAWAETEEIFSVSCSNSDAPEGWSVHVEYASGYWQVSAGGNAYIITSSYDLSSYKSVEINAEIANYGSGSGNAKAKYEISYDGGETFTETGTAGSPTSSTYVSANYTLKSVSSRVVIKVTNNLTSGRVMRFKNFKLIGTKKEIGADPYTVTFSDGGSVTETAGGAGVTLPSRNAIGEYTFAGWSETNVETETTTAPTIIPIGTYHPTANITLYPVYTRTEGGGTTQNKTASVNIGQYATAHKWANGTAYQPVVMDDNISVGGTVSGNNFKYYSSDSSWRFYTNGSFTISASNGATLSSVTLTFNGGTLKYGDTSITSGTAFNVSGNTATISCTANAKVTDISVTYTIPATGTTYYWSSPIAAAVERPVIDVPETFTFSTIATISCDTEDATIKYSFDNETWSDYSEPLTITETTTIYAKGVKGTEESVVVSKSTTKQLATPTVTINATGITNTNVYEGTDAGTLAATVAYNDNAIADAIVTWSGNNNEVATIDAETGIVTLVAAGTVTFTATYAGNSDYAQATATYEMTVTNIDPNAPGTENNPYTVAQAIEYINTLGTSTSPNEVYVSGIISQVDSYNSTYKSITYWISDDGTTSNQMQVYSGKGLNGADFSSMDDLQVRDIVTVKGFVKTYNGTPEFDKNNYLVSFERPASTEPSISVANNNINVTAEDGEGTINVTYENISEVAAEIAFFEEDGTTAATYDWITAEINDNNNIEYLINANDGEARSAYMKVWAYDDDLNEVYSELITITQAAAPGIVDNYELFTGDLVEGDYLIVYEGKAMNTTVDSDRLQYEEVTATDDVITTDNAAIVWHIAPSGEYWTIYNADADAYAASTGAKNKAQMLADGTDDKALWTVSGTETYEFVNKKNTANSVNANLRNNGTYGFACYATSTGGALSLYKKVEPVNDIVITSALWATYVPNQAVTIPTDVTAYIVTNATSTSVTLSSVASAPANTGLVVNGEQGTYTPTAAETTDDVSDNLLVVSNGSVTGDGATIYALGNKGGTVGFKRVANGVNVPAGKPYLTIESNGSKDFFDFSFDEGVATGIESIESFGFDMNAPVYDLQGRQVNRLHKGVFIQNGKKIIVK